MMDFGLRQAAVGDADEIAKIHRECFVDQPWDRDVIEVMLKSQATFGFLVECDASERGGGAGFCLARSASDECEVLSLGVVSQQRRLGLGRRLVEAVKTVATDRCCTALFLEVAQSNRAAQRLYVGCGFAVVGRRKAYYRTATGAVEDALVLKFSGPLA